MRGQKHSVTQSKILGYTMLTRTNSQAWRAAIDNNNAQTRTTESYLLSPRAMVALVSLLHYKCGKIVSLKGKNQKVVKQTYFFNLIGGVDGFTPGYRTGQKFELDPGGTYPGGV